MTNRMRTSVFAARALAIGTAIAGIAFGPGGVASATPWRVPTLPGVVATDGGEMLRSYSRRADRGLTVRDDDPDEGGDDGNDDEADGD